jgi:hypothetical protein
VLEDVRVRWVDGVCLVDILCEVGEVKAEYLGQATEIDLLGKWPRDTWRLEKSTVTELELGCDDDNESDCH